MASDKSFQEVNGRLLNDLWEIGERLVPQRYLPSEDDPRQSAGYCLTHGNYNGRLLRCPMCITECTSPSCPILGTHNTDECAEIGERLVPTSVGKKANARYPQGGAAARCFDAGKCTCSPGAIEELGDGFTARGLAQRTEPRVPTAEKSVEYSPSKPPTELERQRFLTLPSFPETDEDDFESERRF